MIRCSSCGTMLRHDWEGHYDPEDGAFLCDGCYAPELHPNPDDDADIPDDGVQEEWEHPEIVDQWRSLDDACDETDRTAKHTDIGECE